MVDIKAATLEKLATFDTPTICNIIELFDLRPYTAGYMDRRIRAQFPELPPMVGFAATATLTTAIAPAHRVSYGNLSDQVARFAELSGPPVVVLQDLDNPPLAASFGEVMCSTYRAFGAVGLVGSGAGRDIEQIRALDFPIFTDGVICSHGYFHLLEFHVPVHVGGIVVYPDDLLHGDANGVTTIPAEVAADVAAVGEAFIAAEQVILDTLRTEPGNLERLREAQAESKRQITVLRAQLAAKS